MPLQRKKVRKWMADKDYDFIVIGSGFGGAVSALRLAEKGYRVLVLEKGRRYAAEDFPKTNWNLRRWLWIPALRFFGFFKITLFRHIMVFSGVGVGGGSLVYANTLAHPVPEFFRSPGWDGLADWKTELEPHYRTVLRMLGAEINPKLGKGDLALRQLAAERGRSEHFGPARVAVYFGEPGETAADPYFKGSGPERSGCAHCGSCMTGCRHGAKNTLDKNYLYLAESLGVSVCAESEVFDVLPQGDDNSGGYVVRWRRRRGPFRVERSSARTRGVVFAGGVLGTVPLLLRLRRRSLPMLSAAVGASVRTNSETLVGVTAPDRDSVFSEGVAIGSILRTSEHTTLEPVRYGEGSGVWRLLMAPMSDGGGFLRRIFFASKELLLHPLAYLRVFFVDNWAKRTQILLFMQSIESTLRFTLGPLGMRSRSEEGVPPSAFIPEARELTRHFARIVKGRPMALVTETVTGIPSTAHILGGCVIAADATSGVVDSRQQVFGYENLYVCDGSVVPANPGANPSLTIAALAERAMGFIEPKSK
jgi:cholesterol oxidase